MYYIDDNFNIHTNRGDTIIMDLTNTTDQFVAGDVINFYIVRQGNFADVIYKKTVTVESNTDMIEIVLSSQDMTDNFPIIRSGKMTYWYELEYRGNNGIVSTLLGYDEKKAKLFIVYPEAVQLDAPFVGGDDND